MSRSLRVFLVTVWLTALPATAFGHTETTLAEAGPGTCAYLAHNTITIEKPNEVIDSDTGETFGEAVRDALAEICPCYIISIGATGEVQLQSPVDRDAFCDCYCDHLAGCNLIFNLSADQAETKIRRSRTSNKHRRLKVKWNPTNERGGRNANGTKQRPPSVGLAHELIHAIHTINGTRGNTKDEEEAQTIRDENQIRDEMGEPRRTHRGNRRVINPGGGTLDTSDQADCGCEEQ